MILQNRQDYINYRFQKAEEAFDDAQILAKSEKWNAAVNRLYYSCFYAVIALLIKSNIETLTHDGARTQFGLNFIKPGLLDRDMGKLYTKLFDFRQKGDYGDFFDFDSGIVAPLFEQVSLFLSSVKALLSESMT